MSNNGDMRRDLASIDEVIGRGRFKDDWESLQQYRTPQWFENAKFGIFIHWGRVFGAGIRRRMVLADHVRPRFQGIQASHRHIRTAEGFWVQGFQSLRQFVW